MTISINYLAVFLAAVASMVLGFVWYSPALFGKPWMKLMGFTPETLKAAQQKMGKNYGISFIVTLLTAYVLAHIMGFSAGFYNYGKVMTGLSSAFWVWLGFVGPVQLTDVLFGKDKQFPLFLINTGYQLVSLLVMGVIIGLL